MTQAPERLRTITDHDVIPSPSSAGATLLHSEDGDCLVVLRVFRPADKAELMAIVTFRTPSHYAGMRHYFIGCHDASGEFLAQGMRIELTSGTYSQAAREALQRVAGPIAES